MMSDREINVDVDLDNDVAVITITKKLSIFNKYGRFLIEYDKYGFSAIDKEQDGYHEVVYLYQRKIQDRKLSEDEVKHIINKVLKQRYEEIARCV
jgi:hypothetical protein